MADQIQIGDVAPRVRYTADGVTALFSFPFSIFSNADLEVYVDDVLKIVVTDYTVSDAGAYAGGVVTFGSPPAANATVTLVRRLTLQRVSDFLSSGDFKASAINDELDILTAGQQQTNDDLTRALRLSMIDGEAELELPDAPSRAGRTLVFGADGQTGVRTVLRASGLGISAATPLGDSAMGDAGSSETVSAADHAHPLPSFTDIGYASQAEAEAGTLNNGVMTPLRARQAIAALGSSFDQMARDQAANALAYVMATVDLASIGGIAGRFNLIDAFDADTLITSTNAAYDAGGNYYHNAGTLSGADAVPTMSGYTSSGVTIAESGSSPGHESWRVFDDLGDAYASAWASASNSNQWLSVDFGSPVKIAAYRLRPRNIDSNDLPMAPTAFHLDGWNGASWDVLDNRTGISWGAHDYQQFAVATPVAYSKFRLYAVSNASGYEISIGEVELLPLTAPANMTLVPAPNSLSTPDPLDVAGYFVFEPIDDVTFGTDIAGAVSIDGGSTFTTGAWSKIGDIGSTGCALYRLDADVSGQSGSSLTYRLATANNKEIRYHDCVGFVASY